MFNSASLYPARSLLSRIRARQSAAAGVENAGADPRERESLKECASLKFKLPGQLQRTGELYVQSRFMYIISTAYEV